MPNGLKIKEILLRSDLCDNYWSCIKEGDGRLSCTCLTCETGSQLIGDEISAEDVRFLHMGDCDSRMMTQTAFILG
jgi:hypothetical protein